MYCTVTVRQCSYTNMNHNGEIVIFNILIENCMEFSMRKPSIVICIRILTDQCDFPLFFHLFLTQMSMNLMTHTEKNHYEFLIKLFACICFSSSTNNEVMWLFSVFFLCFMATTFEYVYHGNKKIETRDRTLFDINRET